MEVMRKDRAYYIHALLLLTFLRKKKHLIFSDPPNPNRSIITGTSKELMDASPPISLVRIR
jgi:hypothetical protein